MPLSSPFSSSSHYSNKHKPKISLRLPFLFPHWISSFIPLSTTPTTSDNPQKSSSHSSFSTNPSPASTSSLPPTKPIPASSPPRYDLESGVRRQGGCRRSTRNSPYSPSFTPPSTGHASPDAIHKRLLSLEPP